jgi:hypothetical protein
MARDPSDVLRQAMEFFIAGHIIEARALLLDLVRKNPQLEAGWMFLSYTLDDPAQQQDCLRQVLIVNPDNEEARLKLEQLQSVQAKPPKPEPPPLQQTPRKTEGGTAQRPEERESTPAFVSPLTNPTVPSLLHASPFTVDISHVNDIPPDRTAGQNLPPQSEPFFTEEEPAGENADIVAAPEQSVAAPVRSRATGFQPQAVAEETKLKSESPVKTAPLSAKESPEKEKSGGRGCMYALLGGVLMLLVVGIAGVWLYANGYIPMPVPPGGVDPQTGVPQFTDTPMIWTLPPQWTDTPIKTATPRATITPTATQTQTPTLAPPAPEIREEMNAVEQQVVGLRGLTWSGTLPVYFIDKDRAETILQELLQESGYPATIEDRRRALVALGLIRKTFNLSAFELSNLAESVDAFYTPRDKAVYIIGDRLDVREKRLYSHEFDHALISQHFPSADIMDDDPLCKGDTQRCEAVRALVEGDATLLELEWYERYIGESVPLEPTENPQPTVQFIPPYISPDVQFAYVYGTKFIAYLWNIGQWAKVNEAYQNPPLSTEQIIHPEKFLLNEKPVSVDIPDLGKVLGEKWRMVGNDVLGEYMTYLVLGYGMDVSAIDAQEELTAIRDRALDAAAGWGGDQYEVFYNESSQQTILVAEWVWDYPKDETEFAESMKENLNLRFRGVKVDRLGADCWQYGRETTCVFQTSARTLWILAPDMQILNDILAAYPGYS